MAKRVNDVVLFIVLFLIFFLIQTAQPANALSLHGQQLSPITYLPGETIVNHYSISDTIYPVEVTLGGGELLDYISVSEIANNEFDLIISFPEKLIGPGEHSFSLTVSEKADEMMGISSLLSVTKAFRLIAYSREKEVAVSFSAADVNQGTPVKLELGVASQTYSDIDSVKAVIFVYDKSNHSIGELATEEKSLPALKSASFLAFFNTTNLPYDDYHARAIITYDGQEKEATANFKIGEMDVIMENYTRELTPGFSEFAITVANNWGNELNNVYAKLFVNGQELLQTPSISLPAWGKGVLGGIIKVDLSPGIYPGVAQIFFEGESKEEQITLTVLEPPREPEERQAAVVVPYLIFLIALVVVVGVFITIVLSRRKNEGF